MEMNVDYQPIDTDTCVVCHHSWKYHTENYSDHWFESIDQRDIEPSSSQTKHYSSNKLPYDQVPVEMLSELAKVLDYGANKYSKDNWKLGTNWSEFYGSTLRHIYSWWRGEDIDLESNCLHLAHAICNLTFLIYYYKHNKGTDNREP